MNGYHRVPNGWMPALGCFSIVAVVFLMCLMPFILVDVMQTALERLHLSPPTAAAAVIGIFLGGLINVPVYRIERQELQPVEVLGALGLWAWTPRLQRVRRDTVIAVNAGGCLVPLALAVWQAVHIVRAGGWPVLAMAIVVLGNVLVCFLVARPVSGVGIMMPGFASPLTAVGLTWLMLMPAEFNPVRAAVAFVGGIAGPLIGADLLHLKDITRVSVGMLSIGGAGTFDGIVLSGVLAALLA